MEKKITKTDIIVQAFGVTNPEIQRLVELEAKVRASAALAETDVKDQMEYGVTMEVVMEWKLLMDKFYKDAVEVLEKRCKELN